MTQAATLLRCPAPGAHVSLVVPAFCLAVDIRLFVSLGGTLLDGRAMSTEEDIRKASAKFYAGLNSTLNGDSTPMADVWSHNPDVSAMHPIDAIAVGWDEIRASFEILPRSPRTGGLNCVINAFASARILLMRQALSMSMVCSVKTKFRQSSGIRVYRREGSEWKMVHHHVDFDPRILEIVSKLQTSPQT